MKTLPWGHTENPKWGWDFKAGRLEGRGQCRMTSQVVIHFLSESLSMMPSDVTYMTEVLLIIGNQGAQRGLGNR